MRIVSWNVNGLRACARKGFRQFLAAADADIMFGRVNELYPSYRLPHLLRLSAEAVMSARGRR